MVILSQHKTFLYLQIEYTSEKKNIYKIKDGKNSYKFTFLIFLYLQETVNRK